MQDVIYGRRSKLPKNRSIIVYETIHTQLGKIYNVLKKFKVGMNWVFSLSSFFFNDFSSFEHHACLCNSCSFSCSSCIFVFAFKYQNVKIVLELTGLCLICCFGFAIYPICVGITIIFFTGISTIIDFCGFLSDDSCNV